MTAIILIHIYHSSSLSLFIFMMVAMMMIMNKQHTYREFLALLPSRPQHSNRKQKYANRLTNYESYYRSQQHRLPKPRSSSSSPSPPLISTNNNNKNNNNNNKNTSSALPSIQTTTTQKLTKRRRMTQQLSRSFFSSLNSTIKSLN